MFKWIKPKWKSPCSEPQSFDSARITSLEHSIQNLRHQVDALEKSVVALASKEISQSRIEYHPKPNRVGRPRKK